MSDSITPRGLFHARLPCPALSPGVCSDSCLFESGMLSNHLILCHPLLLLPSIFPVTDPNFVSNLTLFETSQKNGRLLTALIPITHPTWLYNLSLFTREGSAVLEVLAYCVPPLPGKVVKPLFLSPPHNSPYFCLVLVHREPRFWHQKDNMNMLAFFIAVPTYPFSFRSFKMHFFYTIFSTTLLFRP